jgi:hypothetical protein
VVEFLPDKPVTVSEFHTVFPLGLHPKLFRVIALTRRFCSRVKRDQDPLPDIFASSSVIFIYIAHIQLYGKL